VVHEHEALWPIGEELVHLGIADRRVVDEHVVARGHRCALVILLEMEDLARDPRVHVEGVHLRWSETPQHVAQLEREVRDRVTAGRRHENLMDGQLLERHERVVLRREQQPVEPGEVGGGDRAGIGIILEHLVIGGR
jgi:hypothetical protein